VGKLINTPIWGHGGQKEKPIILLLFFFSGLAALIYQIIWLRSLSTIFGSTVYATTTVLSSFMGGLALGSYIFGKAADTNRRPLRLYGILEIGIGVFALAFPVLMGVYDDVYPYLQQKTALSFYGLSLVRFLVVSSVLIVPTTMMGGTFPIINRYYIRNYSHLTSNVSLLYGLNTFGAVTGVLLAGFFLMETVGILKTSYVAVTINIGVGIIAIVLQKVKLGEAGAVQTGAKVTDTLRNATVKSDEWFHSRRLIIIAAFLSGLTALSYEVIWTKTLVFVLDSFVYSFSIMLATFLTGIAIGSLVISRIASRIRYGYGLLCVLFILIGFSALSTFPFFSELSMWKRSYLISLSENADLDSPTPWGKYILFKFLISALIMAVPTLLMGAAFPLIIKLYSSTLKNIGREIGSVYASNTLGAILGAFITGFVLIPFLGLRDSLLTAAGLSALTGMVLLLLQPGSPLFKRIVKTAVPGVLFALVVTFFPTDVYERVFQRSQKDYELVYYDEDPTSVITVHKRGEKVIINVNGLNVAGTAFEFLTTQKIQAHLGLLLHEKPERVLQVGFGSGGTCYSVSQHKSVKAIDCVEICPGVIKAAGYFIPSNHQVLKNPIVNVTIEDARNFVLATPHRYDLILSDSIHPTYAGNGTLYSRDYFLLCKDKLKNGGYVSFWMPTYLLSPRDYKTIIKTFQSVFPYVTIWYVNTAIEAYSIVIGREEPFVIDVDRLRSRLADPDVAGDLATIDVFDEYDVLSYFMLGPEKSEAFAREADINSDDWPIIELRAPKSMTRRRTWFKNLNGLAEMRESPLRLTTNAWNTKEEQHVFEAELERLYKAIGMLIQGQLINLASYNFDQEYRYYEKAAAIHPENRAIRRMKALATSRVLIQRGEWLFRKSRYDESFDSFEKAIAVNPDPYDDSVGYAHYRLGSIYRKRGDFAKASSEFDICLGVFPNHKEALILGAKTDLNLSNRSRAKQKIDRLIRLYPRDGDVKELRNRLRASG
jgi:spermidine synthase